MVDEARRDCGMEKRVGCWGLAWLEFSAKRELKWQFLARQAIQLSQFHEPFVVEADVFPNLWYKEMGTVFSKNITRRRLDRSPKRHPGNRFGKGSGGVGSDRKKIVFNFRGILVVPLALHILNVYGFSGFEGVRVILRLDYWGKVKFTLGLFPQ